MFVIVSLSDFLKLPAKTPRYKIEDRRNKDICFILNNNLIDLGKGCKYIEIVQTKNPTDIFSEIFCFEGNLKKLTIQSGFRYKNRGSLYGKYIRIWLEVIAILRQSTGFSAGCNLPNLPFQH